MVKKRAHSPTRASGIGRLVHHNPEAVHAEGSVRRVRDELLDDYRLDVAIPSVLLAYVY